MGSKIKANVDLSSDENANKISKSANRALVVSQFIEEFELPKEVDVILDIPVSLIDSKIRTSDGKVVDNYVGRLMGHDYLGSSEFLALKNDIFHNGIRTPIVVMVSSQKDQIVVSDGRSRLTVVRTLLNESHQMNDSQSVQRFSTVPCVVKTVFFDRFNDDEADELLDDAFLMNFFKRNDSFYSETWAVGRLSSKGVSSREIESKLGKKRSWVKERLNLSLCLEDDEYGSKIRTIIEKDKGVKLTKRVLSLIFSKNHSAAGTISEAYQRLLSIVEKKPQTERKGASKSKHYSPKYLYSAIEEVKAEFNSSEIDAFVDALREKLSLNN